MLKKLVVFILGILFGLYGSFLYQANIDKFQTVPQTNHAQVNNQTVKYELDSDKLWKIVNNWRTSQNLPAYVKNEQLCTIADERIAYIQKNWSHDGFRENLSTYKNISGYKYLGENLSRNNFSETVALDAWLNSPGHLENLKLPFTHSCIATDGLYAVQIFGSY